MSGETLSTPETIDNSKPQIFWRSVDANIAVVRPTLPAIPLTEGHHFVVTNAIGSEKSSWRDQDPRKTLRQAFIAAGVAKWVAESRDSKDGWANIHFDRGVSIYGRNPTSDIAWGKPVVKDFGVENPSLPSGLTKNIKRDFSHYLPLWEHKITEISVFQNGINALDADSQEFRQEAEVYANKLDPFKEDLLWSNGKIDLVNVRVPHLNGVHLVAHPSEAYAKQLGQKFERPWQTHVSPMQATDEYLKWYLEMIAILQGAERLLIEDTQIGFNPEVHFSGNWAKGLQPVEKGGKLDVTQAIGTDTDWKNSKRNHRPGNPFDFVTATHGHLYATDDPKHLVHLPTRPAAEVPEEWQGIEPMLPEQVADMKRTLQTGLTLFLEGNAQGSLMKTA